MPGLLGIGGGIVIGPLLLELGADPVMAAATSALMVLFSSSSAALAYGTLSFCRRLVLQQFLRQHQACEAIVMRQRSVCARAGRPRCCFRPVISLILSAIACCLAHYGHGAGVEGSLNLRFGVAFGTACCAASLIGVAVISHVVRKSGKVCPSRGS